MRQRLKSRIKARRRAHLKQRLTFRVLNFGGRVARTFTDVFAINGNEKGSNEPSVILTRWARIVNENTQFLGVSMAQ
jgi:hypothetical protein